MFERYTERARRVIFFARYEASQLGSGAIETEHLLLGLIREGKGLTSRLFAKGHLSMDQIRKDVEGRSPYREKVSTSLDIPLSTESKRVLGHAAEEAERLLHNYIGTEHILLGLMREERSTAATILVREGHAPRRRARGHPRAPEREGDRGKVEGDAAPLGVLPRPDGGGGAGRPRPARGAGRGARARHPDPVPAHPEQPGPDRGAGGGQDRARGGPREQGRPGRRADLPRRQARPRPRHLADRGRHEVPRAVRGAAQDDHEGAHRDPEHHHLHRRAAHPGGGGLGRGVARRGQHPQAGPLARRDPVHRGDDPRRVPQAHREGPGPRAALPGGQGRLADRGGDGRDPPRGQGALREVPQRGLPRRGDRGGGVPVEPLHHGPLPARQGDRPHRRGRQPREAARGRGSRAGARGPGPAAGRARAGRGGAGRRLLPGGRGRGARERQRAERAVDARVRGAAAGDEGRHRRRGLALDRDPDHLPQGGGVGEAAAHGGGAAPADRVAGRRDQRGGEGHPPHPGRAQEPEPAGGLVPLPRAHRGRQDRGRARPRRLPLRQRAQPHPLRHVGVHGEALGQQADRLAARVRGARGGRAAHRAGEAQPTAWCSRE